MRIPFTAAVVSALLSLLAAASLAQVAEPESEIKITVVDQSDARIPDSELVFRSQAKSIIVRAGNDGAATVALPAGQYAVITSHFGFLKNEMSDFQVVAWQPNELKIVLNVGGPAMVCTLPCGPMLALEVPTITSDLPMVIPPDPAPEPSAKTMNSRVRSWRCLYLWKCYQPWIRSKM